MSTERIPSPLLSAADIKREPEEEKCLLIITPQEPSRFALGNKPKSCLDYDQERKPDIKMEIKYDFNSNNYGYLDSQRLKLEIHNNPKMDVKPFVWTTADKLLQETKPPVLKVEYKPKPFSMSRSDLLSITICHAEKKKPKNKNICHAEKKKPKNKKLKKAKENLCQQKLSSMQTNKGVRRDKQKKLYSCSICHNNFSQISGLKEHFAIHIGDEPCSCKICGKKFRYVSDLERHIPEHADQRYPCTTCGKEFARHESLKSHKLTHAHTADNANSCRVCKKTFIHSGALTQHMQTHAAANPHKCTICGVECAHIKGLKRHIRKKHT